VSAFTESLEGVRRALSSLEAAHSFGYGEATVNERRVALAEAIALLAARSPEEYGAIADALKQ